MIDDILGVVALNCDKQRLTQASIFLVYSLKSYYSLCLPLLQVLCFICFSSGGQEKADHDLRRFVIVAFVFCLLLSYVAEEWFGVADITGAYIAGLVIANTQRTKYVASQDLVHYPIYCYHRYFLPV